MAEVDDGADERGAAFRRVDARECFEKPGEVVGVARALAGIARGANPRSAAQRVDDDARIVGERRQAGRRARGARLDERVLHECEAGLFRLLDPVRILRDDVQPGGLQQRTQLLELAGVGACEHDLHDRIVSGAASGHGRGGFSHRSVRGNASGPRRCRGRHSTRRAESPAPKPGRRVKHSQESGVGRRRTAGCGSAVRRTHDSARTARCSSMRDVMPRRASSSIASSSSRRNAWPSAVPWISMNPPASFITTFMSVSASESSA